MSKIISKFITLFTVLIPTFVFAQAESAQPASEPEIIKSLTGVAQEQLDTAKDLIQMITEFFVKYSFQVLGGLIVLVIGWLVGKYLARITSRFLEKKGVDVTVAKFIVGIVKLTVMVFAFIVALGKFGIEIAPLIAGLSVAGVGISFALQGPLSNFAAGATLIFTKPFKVGDIIEVAGVAGEVLDLKLPKTELRTVDGNMVIVPNKHIVGEIIHNFSGSKKLDINVGVTYGGDVQKAIDIVKQVIKNDKRVVKEPNVGISEFADSSVNIYARLWCKQNDYWNVMFDLNKTIFDEFGKNGVEIPFPQRDVHLFQEKK